MRQKELYPFKISSKNQFELGSQWQFTKPIYSEKTNKILLLFEVEQASLN